MRTRLTERDLSRIVRRVINEENKLVKGDPCLEKINKLEQTPKYQKAKEKIFKYNELEWWEWYDKMALSPTSEELAAYDEYVKKFIDIVNDCYKNVDPKKGYYNKNS